MFGVVLWSNVDERKAVIWCEDHGDLAFYRQPENGRAVTLDAGDWVQFDLTTDRHLRLAHNPRLISEGVYEGLAEALDGPETRRGLDQAGRGRDGAGATAAPVQADRQGSAEIIPISSRRAARDAGLFRTTAVPA